MHPWPFVFIVIHRLCIDTVRSVGVVVVSCSGRPGRRDEEEQGPIGFLAGGGPKFEVTPLPLRGQKLSPLQPRVFTTTKGPAIELRGLSPP